MNRKKKIDLVETEYKTYIEKFYEKHKWYRHLVFLSRIARMGLYLLFGVSTILFVINGSKLKTIESFIYSLVSTTFGKIIALIFGFLLIIYGIEKPRG